MVLPQLSPRRDDARKPLLRCHHLRLTRSDYNVFFAARIQYLYTSRAKIYMTRIIWGDDPLPLFSDEKKIGFESLYNFQSKDVGSVNKHHVQMGLPEGHSMLVHDAIEGKQYQAILASMSTVPGRKRKAEHAMWKHVKTTSTSFAWLSPELANAFCWDALQKDGIWKYGNFGVAHLGLG